MATKRIRVEDISTPSEQLVELRAEDLMPIPHDARETQPPLKGVNPERRKALETTLDGYSALGLPRPQSPEEEEKLAEKFLSGLGKLISKDSNWTFWQPLQLSLDNCTRCQT